MADIKVVYVSGKISNLPKYEVEVKFQSAKERLLKQGFDVVLMPTEIREPNEEEIAERMQRYGVLREVAIWQYYMKHCFGMIMNCTHIYMLADWTDSRGARIELAMARETGLEVLFEKEMDCPECCVINSRVFHPMCNTEECPSINKVKGRKLWLATM